MKNRFGIQPIRLKVRCKLRQIELEREEKEEERALKDLNRNHEELRVREENRARSERIEI